MYVPPKNDAEYSLRRLNGILSRRRLTFNPYTVSDSRLLELIETVGWGNNLDIVQMVVLQFTRLRPTKDWRKFDGIHFRLGNQSGEGFIPRSTLAEGITANDTVSRQRSWIGKTPLYNSEDVEKLVGKTVFVSRVIRGVNIQGYPRCAYRMHRLKGKPAKDAAVIREAMCSAKIEMLERILAYPESPDYLSCSKDFIDYEPRIRRAIEIIRHFPDTPVPQDTDTIP